MADWTDNERTHAPQFDRALALRDAGLLDQALDRLQELVAQLTTADARLLLHAHLQIVHLLKMLARTGEAEVHARFAVQLAPRAELASLALFHVLTDLARPVEALTETVRFLSLRESLGYRELFAADAYTTGVPGEQRKLAKQARQLLAKHREAQRARDVPQVRDTVRIRTTAPAAMRPGRLASVYSTEGHSLKVAFSDGVIVEVPATLVDLHDI